MLGIRHAVENASNAPITDKAIIAILQGQAGLPSHLWAVFGDASLSVIAAAAAANGIPMRTVLAAYRAAKATAAAANPATEVLIRESWPGKGSIGNACSRTPRRLPATL